MPNADRLGRGTTKTATLQELQRLFSAIPPKRFNKQNLKEISKFYRAQLCTEIAFGRTETQKMTRVAAARVQNKWIHKEG
jgi:hypothetical protein